MKITNLFTAAMIGVLPALCSCANKGAKHSDDTNKEALGKLCDGVKANGNEPITKVSEQQGEVCYDDAVKKYRISMHVDGTYDCIIVGYLEGDYSQINGAKVQYEADVYESNIPRKGPAGIVNYTFKNFKYKIVN